MSYKLKVSVVVCLLFLVCCMVSPYASSATTSYTRLWIETSPISGGNVYYGNVSDDNYYTAQIDGGILEYSKVTRVNYYTYGAGASKCAVPITVEGVTTIYFSGSNSSPVNRKLVDWSTPSDITATGLLESMTTDGTCIYSNDYSGTGKNPIRRYSISDDPNVLSVDWSTTLSAAKRIRGLSYYAPDNVVYVADGLGDVYELNATTGTVNNGGSAIFHVDGMDGSTPLSLYQAVRYTNTMYVVGASTLFTYKLSGGVWSLAGTQDPGLGMIMGIGINATGTGIWLSSTSGQISYWDVSTPHTATGEITLGDFSADTTGIPVRVTITNVDTSVVREVDTTLVGTTAGKGKFSVSDVMPGKYNVSIKPSHWLKYTVQHTTQNPLVLNMPNDDRDLGPVLNPSFSGDWIFINGDINGSNKVDFTDYNLMMQQYKKPDLVTTNCADLNGDGAVNFTDYNILMRNYKKSGNP